MARVRKITTMAELNAALMAAFNAINRDYYGGELEKVTEEINRITEINYNLHKKYITTIEKNTISAESKVNAAVLKQVKL